MEKKQGLIALFCSILFCLQFTSAQDYNGWTTTTTGSGFTKTLYSRTNELDTSKSYYSPKSILLSKSSLKSYGSVTITKSFSITELKSHISVQPSKLYLSLWQRDSTINTNFAKQVIVNGIILSTQYVNNLNWQNLKLDISSYLQSPSITVSIKLYSNLNTNATVFTYWDNIAIYFDTLSNRNYRTNQLRNSKVTYAGIEDLSHEYLNGDTSHDNLRIDSLMNELQYNEANIYSYLIWYDPVNTSNYIRWNVLKNQILPKLKLINKDCWATLIPPSEAYDNTIPSMPYGLDFIRWAKELAGLSLEYSNFKGFNIDDFDCTNGLQFFSPNYVRSMIKNGSHLINPLLSFVTTSYYDHTSGFIVHEDPEREPRIKNPNYLLNIDGIVFPFIWKSNGPWGSLYNTNKYYDQMDEFRNNLNFYTPYLDNVPLLTLIYVWGYSTDDMISTPEYVYELGQKAKEKADGIVGYVQYLNWQEAYYPHELLSRKREIIRNIFNTWSANLLDDRIIVMNNGHELFYGSDSTYQNYMFCPDWYNKTQELDFDNIQYLLAGDYDGDGLTDVAMYYDYPGTLSSTPQRIFMFPDRTGPNSSMEKFQFKLRNGTEAENSWLNTTIYNHNFDFHQYGLAGDFDGNGKDEMALLYDYNGDDNSNSNTPQRIFVYKKNQSTNKFEIAWGTDSVGSWFNSTIYNHNFDCHQLGVSGDFDGNGKDELMFFYDYEGTNSTTPQRVFMYRQDNSGVNKFNIWWGAGFSGAWLDTTKVFDFDLIAQVLVADFDQDLKDEIAILYDAPDKQEIFVYKVNPNNGKLFKIIGTKTDGSWWYSTISDHNFDLHKIRLAGRFDRNTKPDLIFYYDRLTSENRQSIFLYQKNDALNQFDLARGDAGDPFSQDLFYHKIFDYSNFDYYKYAVSGNFYDESSFISPNRDDIVVFYKKAIASNKETDESSKLESLENVVSDFELLQNYPNPFNPNTTIRYQIPADGLVSIKVYDILGVEVKTLVNEEKPAGRYEVEFNANNLASGIYFYRIQAGEFVDTKKMILLK